MSLATAALEPDALGGGAVEVDVTPIDGEGWRVSISHADRDNPFALLGFITAVATPVGERYQVCVIGRPFEEIERATLAEAVDELRPQPDQVEAILAGTRH